MTTSAVIIELKSPMSVLRCSTTSMPRSRSSTSALTMFTPGAMACSSRPAAKAADSSRVSFLATSPL